MSEPTSITLQASAPQTANGAAAGINIEEYRGAAKLILDISAASGTFTTAQGLTVIVETSPTGLSWQEAGRFPQVRATGFRKLAVSGLEQHVRVRWEITGTATPSFTFSVFGVAHQVFAQMEDVSALGLSDEATKQVTATSADKRARALIAQSDVVFGYLKQAEKTPALTWGDDIRRAAAVLAAYDIICETGFDPNEYDANFRTRYEDVIKWLEKVAAGEVDPSPGDPDDDDDDDDDTDSGGAFVVTEPKRGW